MSTVVNNILFFKESVITSIKSTKEYKVSFVVKTIFMMLNNFAWLFSWYIILNNTGEDSFFSYSKLMYLYSISAVGYGFTHFFFGGVENINRFLIDGDLDTYILKPKSVLVNVLTSKCTFSACGDIIFGLALGYLASKNIVTFLKILILSIFGMIILLSVEIIFRSICVWIGDTETLVSRVITSIFISISTYPIEVFSFGIKLVATTIIPAYYAVHLPLDILTDFSFTKLVILILATIFFLTIAIKIFNCALKKYESGNNISLRM